MIDPWIIASNITAKKSRMRFCPCQLPHTDSFGEGLFELRLKGVEGIARVFFCALVGRRIMMLHAFIRKTQKTPLREIETARKRMKEVKYANPR